MEWKVIGNVFAALVIAKGIHILAKVWKADGDLRLLSKSMKWEYFSNKCIWITGASSGIGLELARQLAEVQNISLILSSRRTDVLKSVKSNLVSEFSVPENKIKIIPIDLGELDKLQESLEKHASIYAEADILINNAGLSQRSLGATSGLNVFERLIKVNYLGQVVVIKSFIEGIKQMNKIGHIVNVSTIAAKFPAPFRSGYGASKAALNLFSDVLKVELDHCHPGSMKWTTVHPGGVVTDISSNALSADGRPFGRNDGVTREGMHVSRAAQLILTATSNKLEEACIGNRKELIVTMLFSFLPKNIAINIMKSKYRSYMNETISAIQSM